MLYLFRTGVIHLALNSRGSSMVQIVSDVQLNTVMWLMIQILWLLHSRYNRMIKPPFNQNRSDTTDMHLLRSLILFRSRPLEKWKNSCNANIFQGSCGSWKTWKVLEFCFLSFPGLESHGILCRVMESRGKQNHYKKLWFDLYCVSW